MKALEGETVAQQINSSARQQRQMNRKKLGSIIETVIFCGRQGMPLWGHRDAGPLTLEDPIKNDGNFRALLRFKMRCGDDRLKEDVLAAPGNATSGYVSECALAAADTCTSPGNSSRGRTFFLHSSTT
ncbi:hypothetical protein HPB48_019897 [Haemaphysalis longicornis]|uniref:Uncharacterized protein n=1 Tax=Haemaphysalis longicornis TaxID=44386 RepID=A0A9J6GKH6_HAELO|nr:hypothetical protein HPB48_019897 [Haemaphysalis longicornis]